MQKSSNTGGQSNLDFLVGMTVFLLGFLYVITFIPGLFMPYQSGAVDLSSVAYKTCAVLVEDPGWYTYDTDKGNPEWESRLDFTGPGRLDLSLPAVQRLGLADDKYSPNILSMDKVNALQNLYDAGQYARIQEKTGLSGSVKYDCNMKLTMTNLDSPAKPVETPLNIQTAEPGLFMETMERNVQVDMGKQLVLDYFNTRDTNPKVHEIVVDISTIPSSDSHDVIIRVPPTGHDWSLQYIRWGDDYANYPWMDNYYLLTDGLDYTVKVNGVAVPATTVFTATDLVEITVKHTTLADYGSSYLLIKEVNTYGPILPGAPIDYMNDDIYPRRSIYYPGIFTLEVWSNAL